MMTRNILEMRNVSYMYSDGTKALNGVSLQVKQGAITVFLGPNGAGKSTIFLHLNGLLRPKAGEVIFAGQPISYAKKELQVLRKKVGIVFQDPEVQLFAPSVYQEISIGPKNFGFSDEETQTVVQKAMETVNIAHIQDKAPHHLSYGQKKAVSIADILAVDPDVLILDEPTVWLDPVRKNEMMQLLLTLRAAGKTILISTHDVDLAYSCADEVFLIKDGRVVGNGSRSEIFTDVELLAEVDLEQPWIVQVYVNLFQNGRGSSQKGLDSLPVTKEQLISLLNKKINHCS